MYRENLFRMLTLITYFKVIEIHEEDAIRQGYPHFNPEELAL